MLSKERRVWRLPTFPDQTVKTFKVVPTLVRGDVEEAVVVVEEDPSALVDSGEAIGEGTKEVRATLIRVVTSRRRAPKESDT